MKSAIVLVNLGTPTKPETAQVKAFLKTFLSDPRVVEVPRLLWWLILHLVILPFRSPRVAGAYRQIWMENISPLRHYSQSLVQGLAERIATDYPQCQVEVALAMTYGDPGIAATIDRLRQQGCERFLFIPLYPQYSATTTAAVHDQLGCYFAGQRNIPEWHWIRNYHDHSAYISALAERVREHWQQHGQAKKLLISFHGIPKRNVDLGDPYQQHCQSTAEKLVEALGLTASQWQVSFQSRLGKAEWLQPYTDRTVIELGSQGLESLDVICPAFATECLETLEEIAGEAKELFQHHGGGNFRYIPCLNDEPVHQQLMLELSRIFLKNTKT